MCYAGLWVCYGSNFGASVRKGNTTDRNGMQLNSFLFGTILCGKILLPIIGFSKIQQLQFGKSKKVSNVFGGWKSGASFS